MENILEPNNHFDFSKLSLAQPIGINGGAYFTKFLYNAQPFYIETPKCLTKQGFIKHGKKIYTELMFDNSDSHFIHWIENLETTCHKLIYENSESWFKDKLELNDIESAFTASLKTYRSGKYYLLRVYGKINNLTNNPNVKIYNENETLLTTEDIKLDTNIISIIELQGIKFTNKSFQIEFEIKQMMVLIVDKLFESCVIKKHKNVSMHQQQQQQQQQLTNKVTDTFTPIKQNELIEELGKNEDFEENENLEEVEENELGKILGKEFATEIVNEIILKENIQVAEDVNEDIKIETEIKKDNIVKKENKIENEIEDQEENTLEEFDINDKLNSLETITLKKPNEVYYKIYKEARQKAKQIKREAINAILEAKNIKNTYMIDSDSDSDVDSVFDEDSETIDLDLDI
jgi:hypothetical protein